MRGTSGDHPGGWLRNLCAQAQVDDAFVEATAAEQKQARRLQRLPAKAPTPREWAAARGGPAVPTPLPADRMAPHIQDLRRAMTELACGPPATLLTQPEGVCIAAAATPEADMYRGRCHSFLPAWLALAELAGIQDEEVLRWLRGGVALRWCETNDAQKATEPDHARKHADVCRALREAGFTQVQVRGAFAGATPAPAVFPKRLSDPADLEFARGEVRVGLRRGAMVRWPWRRARPRVVLPLFVARSSSGKRRLILNARYVNLWCQYYPFAYETSPACCSTRAQAAGSTSSTSKRATTTSAWTPRAGRT